ncbi:hypothetical protein XA68_12100 [Ophiocordyceps unilateralis]|uniref:Cryptochrome DASH n=1 Tax=Ophiocordyceps unilateralis TaxID=268505 RepID=A0A2A9PFE6_OPHUN|nr:hypothetical protein XA68_12100 [Ophiocordyceps unilateralis]
MVAGSKLLVYILRRDLRVSDNPILHHLATSSDHGYTHLLPVYVYPAHQIEVSGFLRQEQQSPYPPARSLVGGYWRCGPHRAKFISQAVWDLKASLQQTGSGLIIRVGDVKDVLDHLIRELEAKQSKPVAVWMTEELSWEEGQEQDDVATLCSDNGVDFKLWTDEKYFVDDRDTDLAKPQQLPDVFTTYRKSQEPLRERPRKVLPAPAATALPPLPDESGIPNQHGPFDIPDSLDQTVANLLRPLEDILSDPPQFPDDAESGHPFQGGESHAQKRLKHLLLSGAATAYKDTRNGLLGADFSTKLSAYLALGCISARQIHEALLKFEDGQDAVYQGVRGYGNGENEGTKGIRFELLWRDYMRLCTAKFGRKLFRLSGFTQDKSYGSKWKSADKKMAPIGQSPSPGEVAKLLDRFQRGTTGMGLIDASQRELFLTGYTSNRARQNAASFLAKHLEIDWRYGAEWYEMMLIDYDVSSNWANWQYVAGVGNDPRGDARIFNPVKQAFDYDKEGTYVRTWVPELKDLEKPENVFQAWTTSPDDLAKAGLTDNIMVTDPLKRIDFKLDRKPRSSRRPFPRKRGGNGRGGGGRRGQNGGGPHHGGTNRSERSGGAAASGAGNDATPEPRKQNSGANNYTTSNNQESAMFYRAKQHNNRGQLEVPSGFAPGGGWSPYQPMRARGSQNPHFGSRGSMYSYHYNYRPGFVEERHYQPPFGPMAAYSAMHPGQYH